MRKFYVVIALSLTIAVAVGSFLPPKHIPTTVSVSDKLLHTVAYFVITLFWLLSNITSSIAQKIKILAAVLLFGVIVEILQGMLTNNRHSEFLDVIANTVGILTAYFIFSLIFKKKAEVSKNNL